jgi:hypothetical protein
MANESREIEIGYLSLNKKGEELCGDHVETITGAAGDAVMVLADGLGSGVKANILSILTSSIICSMMESGLSIEECASAVAKTLPVAVDRGNVAYSTFTVVKISSGEIATIYNYDNPEPVFLHDGHQKTLDWESEDIAGKRIFKTTVSLSLYDTIVLVSDGAVYAGVGETMNFGWTRAEIVAYLEGIYSPIYSSKDLATVLADRCDILYNRRPGDDTTAAVIRLRERTVANLLVGPAANSDDDSKMLDLFFSYKGLHIVSGGTTASIAARYLHQNVYSNLEYVDRDVPPTSAIKGVDLVTEGVITLNKVLALAKDYLGANKCYFDWSYKQDGASRVAKVLFEEATDINFFVGCAVNPAHQDPRLEIGFSMKMQIVDELSKELKKMGKHIRVSYF